MLTERVKKLLDAEEWKEYGMERDILTCCGLLWVDSIWSAKGVPTKRLEMKREDFSEEERDRLMEEGFDLFQCTFSNSPSRLCVTGAPEAEPVVSKVRERKA